MKRWFLVASLLLCTGLVSSLSWGGPWLRQWSDAAESTSTTPGSARCAVCHGDFASGWRLGVAPDHNLPGLINTANHRTCEICHVLPVAPYDWGADHNTSPHVIDINSNPNIGYDPATGSCNSACHDNNPPYVMGTSPGFATSGVEGPGPPCTACHGDDTGTDPGRIWPDGIDNNPIRVATIDDEPGAHDNHVGAIGSYLGFGADMTAYGETQQIEICGFCHQDPGAPGHTTNNAPVDRVDVNGAGSFLMYTVGAANYATDTSSAAYNYTTRVCSNLVCHNQNNTPTGTNDWNSPPDWTTGLDAKCTTTTCHDTVTYTNSHNVHSNSSAGAIRGVSYPCTQCHQDNGSDLRHQNGQVDMVFDNVLAGHLEADPAIGGGDGYYDKDNSGDASGGDNSFSYKDGNYDRTCYNIYCHGDDWDPAVKGVDTTPVWNDWTTGSCGACHGSLGSPYFSDPFVWTAEGPFTTKVIQTGAHEPHFAQFIPGTGGTPLDQVDTYGPNFNPHSMSGSCQRCHTTMFSNGAGCSQTRCHPSPNRASSIGDDHINGAVNFQWSDTIGPNVNCDTCHGGSEGAAIAKATWPNTGQRVTCESCHGEFTLARSTTNGTWAPEIVGDGSNYGAAVNGHSLASGSYVSGVPAADLACTDCHDSTKNHITHSLGDTFTDANVRILDTINGQTGFTVVEDVCKACHQSGGGSTLNVVNHGNVNGTFTAKTTHDANAEPFAFRCDACHEPHGLTLNGRTATSTNIYMVKGSVEVMNYSTPGSGATTTDKIAMVFEAETGTNSYDDGNTPTDNICVQCHQNATRPGSGTTMASVNGDHAGLDDFDGNQQGNKCTGCHMHDYDADVSTDDGFMPLECDECHGEPPHVAGSGSGGASSSGYVLDEGQTPHDKHASTGSGVYDFTCESCHDWGQGGQHNANWSFRDVYFDPSTPQGQLNGSSSYTSSTYTCSNIYCHSNAQGTFRTPQWGDATHGSNTDWSSADLSCTACHEGKGAGSGDMSGEHQKHLYGEDYDCDQCHVQTVSASNPTSQINTTTGYGLHVNAVPDVLFTGVIDDNGATENYTSPNCTMIYCHSVGQRTPPTDPLQASDYASPSWTSSPGGFLSSCNICHTVWVLAGGIIDSGSHLMHVGTAAGQYGNGYHGYDCSKCHNIGRATLCGDCHNVHVGANPTPNHTVDGNVDVAIQGTYGASAAYSYGALGGSPAVGDNYGSCENVTCHGADLDPAAQGGDTSPVWGDTTTAQCGDCHLTNTIGEGSHTRHVQSWSYDCTQCHNQVDTIDNGTPEVNDAALHVNLTTNINFDTINGSGTYDTTTDTCSSLYCHGAGTPQWGATGTIECGSCHGRTAGVEDRSSWGQTPDVQGAPPLTTAADTNRYVVGKHEAHVDNSGDLTGDACDLCHLGAGSGSGDHVDFITQVVFHSAAGTSAVYDSSTTPPTCSNLDISCHGTGEWDTQAVGGCDFCHGGGGTGQYWPDGVGGSTDYVDDEPGSHDSHIAAIGTYLGYGNYMSVMYTESQQKIICAFCHPDPGGTDHKLNTAGSPADQVDVLGDGFTAGTFTVFSVGAYATTSDRNSQGTYDQAAKTCSSADCHYEKTTPVYSGAGWDEGDTNAPDCETCHYYRDGGSYPNLAYATGDLPDAHQAHVAGIAPPDPAQSHDYPCSYCHDVTGYTTAHTNGEIDLSDAGSPNQGVDGDTGDEAITPTSTAVKYGAGTADTSCTNLYCHGADFSTATQGTDITPVWNDHMSAVCSDCHDVDVKYSDGSSGPIYNLGQIFDEGKHQLHMDPDSNGPRIFKYTLPEYGDHADNCTYCHGMQDPAGGAGCNSNNCHSAGGYLPNASDEGWVSFPSASHVSGNFEIDFEDQDRGWDHNTNYTGAGTVSVLGTTWDTGTDICNRCHSTATIGGAIGANLAKQYWDSPAYSLPCLNCHNATEPANSYPVTDGYTAPAKDSYFDTDNGGHGYTGVNSGTGNQGAGVACEICHDEDSQHAGTFFPPSPVNSARLETGFTADTICADCHAPDQSSAGTLGVDATVEATDHSTSITGRYSGNAAYDYRCVTCHDPHGTSNIGMIKTTIVDSMGGDATGVTLAAETGLDPTGAADDGVCDRCHSDGGAPHNLTAHPDNHNYGQVCISCHSHKESFYASCTDCHGTDDVRFYPDGGAQNGTAYPNRAGKHYIHITAIAAMSGTVNISDGTSCDWCHPAGSHTGDQSSAPADLHDGTTTTFKDILGNPDGGNTPGSAQQSGGNVSCNGVDCHYENPMPDTEWYGTSSVGCAYCHVYTASVYTPGDLPNAHDIHVDEIADGGYNRFGGARCSVCHPPMYTGPTMNRHQNGIVEVPLGQLSLVSPTNGNETVIPGTGPLAGVLKYGGGNSSDYPSCSGLYCHGDFGDNTIDGVVMSGGNSSNVPNWFDTADGAACGTCHGDTTQPTVNLRAAPAAGTAASLHPNHVAMAVSIGVSCSVCHYDFPVPTANGTYGDGLRHADGGLVISLNNFSGSSTNVDTGYEASTGAPIGSFGNRTCSNIKCHNGVLTPVWADASLPAFGCGSCHQDTAGTSPLPDWATTVAGSHAAHADTDNDYTDCADCHGMEAANYTAGGGTNHLDLIVNLDLPGTGAAYVEVGAPNGSGGVNWLIGGPGNDIDDGTCSNVECHGGGTPQWGVPGTVTCTSCHGNPAIPWLYPSSGGVNGTGYPNRRGRHDNHVAAIANVNSLSTTNDDTCAWCHPGGGHSGDLLPAPADLPDGTTTVFLDILGDQDAGSIAASALQSGAATVSCAGVDCHYETTLPEGGWYGAVSVNCDSCHFWTTPYNAGELPDAHDIHVDEIGVGGGYDMTCTTCHPSQTLPSHQDGIVDMDFSALAYTDGDEALIGSGGDVKFGLGSSVDYYRCENFYCHGDFDDAGIGGGNASNTPNWGVSSSGGCGTCHGNPGEATDSLKAAPTAGNSGSVHVNHVSMAATSPAVNCSVCHYVSWGHEAVRNGSYGNYQLHANGVLQPLDLNNRYGNDPASIIVDWENATGSVLGSTGNYTCSNIVCHNGVTTPVWSDSSISGFSCGDCHQDAAGGSPLPTGDAGVSGSHAAHADTNAVYTDCSKCHGIVAGVYTAFGGTNHQNLVVDLSLPGTSPVYSDPDPAGVNWVAGDGLDDGTCSTVYCHGAATPQWGIAGTFECGSCHGMTAGAEDRSSWGLTPDVQGAPPLTSAADSNRYKVGKHEAHVDNSGDLTGDACDLCHLGAGSGSGDHADLTTQVVFHSTAGTSAVYDSSTTPPTCSNLDISCHGTGEWDTQAVPGCDFCHGYPPTSANNKHAGGVSPVDHDAAGIVSNHRECWFCHGVRDDGSSMPSVMGTSVLKGSYVYSWTDDHRDGLTTMNGNSNADTSDDAGYNVTNGGCDTTACHGNDAVHRVGSGSAVSATLRDLGPGSCSTCHGTDGVRYYPDSQAQNGTGWPNRIGTHPQHVNLLASRFSSVNASDATSCDWCHPGGGHSGDQSAKPADLHDGSSTHFKDILGNIDSGESVAQDGTAQTVSCSGVNCHYNNAPPAAEWYVGSSMGCGYCHTAYLPYTPGALPNAHDIHCDDYADGGYGMGQWGGCMACHITLFNYDHQDGVAQVLFDDPFGVFPDDGDATVVSNGGPLTGQMKYGAGTSADYYSCSGIYCHGDFDDGGINGGNASNTPNWFDTADGAACGTCHGDTGGADETHQAMPITGSTGTIHANHVDMSPSVAVDCSICHYDDTGTNGTYGNNLVHANASLQVALQNAASGATLIADYEDNTASLASTTYGAVTCAAVICHNGVTTPVWSNASSVACGSCHQDTAGSSPLPSWESSVGRSHAAHANTDATYSDCAVCHLAAAANYTATGGTNHQDLVVQIAPSGGSYSESLGSAGVNWSSGSDGVDDGTCSIAACHGSGSPIWGDPSSLVCSDCHATGLNGAPVVTAASTHVDADGSGGTYTAGTCENCHTVHVGSPDTVTIPLPPVSWSNANMAATSMRTQLGINYSAHNGISIGGSGGQIAASISGLTTEAQICWSCHASLTTQVSEWGFNTKTNTTMTGMASVWAAFPTQGDGTAESKNYGWIYDSTYATKTTDWTQGHWMSSYDSLLKRRVASVHSANFDTTGQSSSVAANVVSGTNLVRQGGAGNPSGDSSEPVLESAGQIRCSYCHDVHGTFGPSGKPHLRGTWVGDPYPPELPPRNTYTYTTKISTLSGNLPTPRALASSRDRGGYFIDQNSNSPTLHTSMDTIAETAGLCTLCHGTDIDNLDYYTGSSLWLFSPPGKNGHSNAALGGTRDTNLISDLFTAARYGHDMGMQNVTPRTPWVCSDTLGSCDTNYPQAPLVQWSCETNCQNILNSGWFNTIRTGTSQPMGGDFSNWYGIGTIGGINQAGAKAHNFTCSKCHSPHATGLPALLTQNCIDPSLGNFTVNGYTGSNLIANNCHRKTTTTDGWHILAPSQ